MRWIIDTSAWSRLHRPEVAEQIEALLRADENSELVLSPACELEIMREPQGGAVADKRQELENSMTLLEATGGTFVRAADAMQRLATHQAEAHRRPIPDLITAALADEHGCGVIHLDGDFEMLAEHSGLAFEVFRIELDEDGDGGGQAAHPASTQRALKTELAQLLHQLPIADAEQILADVVEQARKQVAGATP